MSDPHLLVKHPPGISICAWRVHDPFCITKRNTAQKSEICVSKKMNSQKKKKKWDHEDLELGLRIINDLFMAGIHVWTSIPLWRL